MKDAAAHRSPRAEWSLERLARTAKWTALRLRLSLGVRRATRFAPLPLVYVAGALTFIKLTAPPPHQVTTLVGVGALLVAGVVALFLFTVWTKRSMWSGARALDRHHQLNDRITNALSFAAVPKQERTPLMQLAIADCTRQEAELSPRGAAPLQLPKELAVVTLLSLGLVVLALTEVPRGHFEPVVQPKSAPMLMTDDDVELFRDIAKELAETAEDPAAQAAVRKFNQLIEDVAERRLTRREVFSRLAALERNLAAQSEQEKVAQNEGLEALAKALEDSQMSKPIAEPLRQKKLKDAEQAMKKLAERLKQKQNPPSKAELERLRKTLEKASHVQAERTELLKQQQAELKKERDSLLQKKQKSDLKASEQKRLEQLDRQLERLDRERQAAEQVQKEMSELDKKLAEAARELMKAMQEQGQGQESAGDSLEDAAEDLNRMAKKERTQEEKERLLKQLQEMRELMRQQGASGDRRVQQLKGFGQRARGQSGDGAQPGGGKPQLMPGQGQGGTPIPMGQKGGGQGQGQGQGQSQGSGKPGQGDGSSPGAGKEWGQGHDPNIAGDKSGLEAKLQDVTAVASDSGEGSASSEVIAGAAQRGFVGRGYQKVYTDYKGVAERVLNAEEVPAGYRFYVRRYFQLIRPRE